MEIPANSQPVLSQEPNFMPSIQIAKFWRRFLALLIDVVIGAGAQIMIAFLLGEWTFELGPWGRLIGLAWFLLYFGLLNSRLREGQTVGKKVLNLMVVDRQGNHLPLSRSMLRALILALPQLFNGWAIPALASPLMVVVATIIVFGGGLAIFYGVVFDRQTRQGLHDWLAGSYVVEAGFEEGATVILGAPFHRWAMIGLLGAALVLGVVGGGLVAVQNGRSPQPTANEADLLPLYDQLIESERYFNVGVQRVTRAGRSSGQILEDLRITVWVKGECGSPTLNCDVLVDTLARFAFENYGPIDELDGMLITVRNGYDFGLIRGTSTRGAELSLADWRERLEIEE